MVGGERAERRLSELATEALGLELEEARAAGQLGYYARILTQATLPHSRPATAELVRENGDLVVTMLAPSRTGLPYGSIPRLVLAWVTTEAVRTRRRELVLGDHLSGWMRQLGLMPTGGRWGTIPRLRDQLRRLFASSISVSYQTAGRALGAGWTVASQYQLWWDPHAPEQVALWESTVTLGAEFYAAIIERPIPVDLGALRALSRSPLALDLYTWLTYRMSYLRQPTTIPWPALALQLGAAYDRHRDLRRKALAALGKVRQVYPQVRVGEVLDGHGQSMGLRLEPSRTHVRSR